MLLNGEVRSLLLRSALALALLAAFSSALAAATVEVKVGDADGKAVSGATVTLIPSNRQATSGDDGVARFENVAAGVYDVAVRRSGFAPSRTDVTVSESARSAVTRHPRRPRCTSPRR